MKDSWHVFLSGCMNPRAVMRLRGLGKLKKPVTSSGMEHTTFRVVAWCLNRLDNVNGYSFLIPAGYNITLSIIT
jgi:hypothetical protein